MIMSSSTHVYFKCKYNSVTGVFDAFSNKWFCKKNASFLVILLKCHFIFKLCGFSTILLMFQHIFSKYFFGTYIYV